MQTQTADTKQIKKRRMKERTVCSAVVALHKPFKDDCSVVSPHALQLFVGWLVVIKPVVKDIVGVNTRAPRIVEEAGADSAAKRAAEQTQHRAYKSATPR